MQFALFLLVPAFLVLITRAAHVPTRRQDLPVVVGRTFRETDLNNSPSGLDTEGHRKQSTEARIPTKQTTTTTTLPSKEIVEARISQPQRRQFRNADFASQFPPTANLGSATAGQQTSRPRRN